MVTNTVGIIVLAAALVVPMWAQPQPDFSGTWVVESVERSDRPSVGAGDDGARGRGRGRGLPPAGDGPRGGRRGEPRLPSGATPPAQQGDRIRIAQTPDRLIVSTLGANGEQMMSYALNGSETTNMLGSIAVKSKTKWEGVALVTDTTQTVEAQGQSMTRTTREIRSITQDGKLVVRTTVTTPRGNMTTTVTYAKAE